MSFRWILPLAGLWLAGCATTAPEPAATDRPTRPVSGKPLEVSTTESVDKHLFVPEPDESAATLPPFHVHPSVWERMRHSFALPECAEHEISRNWAQWYADRPDYMERVVKRAQPWISYILEEIEYRGLPGELALLPVVESAYDPFAYSSGRALGTWQFISSTGRQYGLKQNWWYDGRRDVLASTHAALDYLMDLHDKFDGDWLLALAGYNAGENRVAREVARNLARGKPGDFWSLRLPHETRGYVPKLLGLTCLFRDPGAYGWRLPDTQDRQVIAAVDPGAQSDLVLISQIAGVAIDVLFTLNPGYNRWATSPDGPYRVVLPTHAAERLEAHLERVGTGALMKWDQVTVQNGDTLSALADVHRVPVSVLRTVNGLDSDMIRVGQRLRLPRDQQLLVDPLYATAAAELQRLQAGLIASDRLIHTVRSGESLSVIARRYDVSVRDLQQWNDIRNPHRLRTGQRLVVFHSPVAPVGRAGPELYIVRSGDSLWSIARRYKVKLNDLMRWNGLSSSSILRPGQSLKILF